MSKIWFKVFSLLAVVVFALNAAIPVFASSLANVYYVSSASGSDTNPGSKTQPWKTIKQAVKTVTSGSTIYVGGGTYVIPSGGWSWKNSGT